MHTRVLTFRGAKNIDDGVAFVRDKAVPVLQEQTGYRSVIASADRDGGVLGILSLWETEADREASFGALAELRQQGLDVVRRRAHGRKLRATGRGDSVAAESGLGAHGHPDQHGSIEDRRERRLLQE